jgi:PAS domain S-box-containing protein
VTARLAAALLALALAVSGAAAWLVVGSDHLEAPEAVLALAISTALAFVSSGLVAWVRRPDNGTGVLMTAVGFVWFLRVLPAADHPAVYTAGVALSAVPFAVFLHAVVAFPRGHLGWRVSQAVVGAAYAVAALVPVATLPFDDFGDPRPVAPLPDNALLAAKNEDVVLALHSFGGLAAVALVTAVVWIFVRRWHAANPRLRRTLGPVYTASALTLVLVAALYGLAPVSDWEEPVSWIALAALLTVPFTFLAVLLRGTLERSGERSRALVAAIPDLMFVIDRNGIYRDFKAENEGLLAAPPEELIGSSVLDVLPADVGERFLSEAELALESGDLRTIDYELVLDGVTRSFEARIVRSGDDEVTAIVRDFTEVRRLQAELRRRVDELQRERDFIRAVVDNTSALFCVVDVEGRIVRFNQAVEAATGWPDDERMRGRRLWDAFVAPEDAESAMLAIADVLAGRDPEEQEHVWLRADGSRFVVAWTAVPILDEGGRQRYLISGTDVTMRKRHEQEIARSRARIVAAADAERRRLERNLHDGAQQRLVSLSLALRLAQAKLGDNPAVAGEMLRGASEELARALEELRELARGIHPAVLTDRGLGAALELLAGRAPVPVEIAELPVERLPEPVEAAAYYLVAEALTNVAKYAQASSVVIRVGRTDSRAVVEIADDGVGGADPARGSGLRGLADRVEALAGRLRVESPEGRGTRLRAEIPLGDSHSS